MNFPQFVIFASLAAACAYCNLAWSRNLMKLWDSEKLPLDPYLRPGGLVLEICDGYFCRLQCNFLYIRNFTLILRLSCFITFVNDQLTRWQG